MAEVPDPTTLPQQAPSGMQSLSGFLFFALASFGTLAFAQGAANPPAASAPAGAGSIAASVYAPTSSGGGMLWLSFITLVLLAGVVLLVAWLVHKNMTATVPNSSIRILSVQTLGPRERIVVASVVGRVFVLGHTASQISLLAELEPQEVTGLSSSPAPVDFATRLSEILRKAKK
ncbi:MAG: FliO/MopB family protein [Betaproteobacteria bacterium]|jgi:flagellar protein FliO/FliZ